MLTIWQDPARQFLQYPPGHYHSPLPHPDDVARAASCRPSGIRHLEGIELHVEEQLGLLATLGLAARDQQFSEQPSPDSRYFFENDFFSYADGILLYALLQHFRPQRVVEVGCGYTSALLLDTRDRMPGLNTKLTFIDPNPGDRLDSLLTAADRATCLLLPQRVQDVGPSPFAELAANDILFIDSSHVAKVGSDVNFLIFEILPMLQSGVLVHIHDIFWPFDYPSHWLAKGWAWNEAYIIHAFLQYNSAFKIRLFFSYLEQCHPEAVQEHLPLTLRRPIGNPEMCGSSLWLQKITI